MKRYTIVEGDIANGFSLFGLFDDMDAALEAAENRRSDDSEYTIMQIFAAEEPGDLLAETKEHA